MRLNGRDWCRSWQSADKASLGRPSISWSRCCEVSAFDESVIEALLQIERQRGQWARLLLLVVGLEETEVLHRLLAHGGFLRELHLADAPDNLAAHRDLLKLDALHLPAQLGRNVAHRLKGLAVYLEESDRVEARGIRQIEHGFFGPHER